jgi:hypothetical protein
MRAGPKRSSRSVATRAGIGGASGVRCARGCSTGGATTVIACIAASHGSVVVTGGST